MQGPEPKEAGGQYIGNGSDWKNHLDVSVIEEEDVHCGSKKPSNHPNDVSVS